MIGTAAGAAGYLQAKKKRNASTSEAAMTGLAVGAGVGAGAALLGAAVGLAISLAVPAAIIGVPLAAAYFWGKYKSQGQVGDGGGRRQLPPGS